MAKLSGRQRLKIKAVLTALQYSGFDVNAVEAQAVALHRAGQTISSAYDRAVANAVSGHPEAQAKLVRIVAQVNASDDATAARYDRALSEYLRTGDEAAFRPVEGIAMRDAVELAVRNGELDRGAVAAGQIDWAAIGMDPETASVSYAAAAEQSATPNGWAETGYSAAREREQAKVEQSAISAAPHAPAAPQRFSFGQGNASANGPGDTGQPAPGAFSVTGYSPAKASARWQNALVVTGRPSPYAGMSPDAIRAAMSEDAAA